MENKELSLILLDQSNHFLLLVENSLNECVKQGNLLYLTSNYEISEEEYYEKTKWSDFNVLIPILFNFYHGIELLMKGIVVLADGKTINSHKLSKIYKILKENHKVPDEIKDVLSFYIEIENMDFWHLKDFIAENNITIDDVYEAFRYPVDNKYTKVYEYGLSLTGREDDIIENFKKIINNCRKLRKEAFRYFRATETVS